MILKINNKKYDFFSSVDVTLTFSGIASTFTFHAYFEPSNQTHKELFRPLKYSKVEVIHGGETLITGRKLSEQFTSSSVPELTPISGYSLSGVFEDCPPALSSYPLQFDGLSLKEIAEKLTKPFDVAIVIDSAVEAKMNAVFGTTETKPTESIASYLTKLASQKSIILSHTSEGALLFTEAAANRKPIADFSNSLKRVISINGQGLHSGVTALSEADIDAGNAGQAELNNPLVQSFRPNVVVQSSGDDNDTELVAKKSRAAELAAIRLTIEHNSWTVNGKIIKPNNIISIQDSSIYLNKRSNWFIDSVTFKGNESSQTSILSCVLPAVYTLEEPVDPFS